MLTTLPFSVQWTKVWPLWGVAVTVCELPAANVPPPLTVPSELGEALTLTVYSRADTLTSVITIEARPLYSGGEFNIHSDVRRQWRVCVGVCQHNRNDPNIKFSQ